MGDLFSLVNGFNGLLPFDESGRGYQIALGVTLPEAAAKDQGFAGQTIR